MDLEYIQWVPVVSFSAVLFIASCGVLSIPYIVLGEMMPDKVRRTFNMHEMNFYFIG